MKASSPLSISRSLPLLAFALLAMGSAGCAPPLNEGPGANVPCTGTVRSASTCYEPERAGSGGSTVTSGSLQSTRAQHHAVTTSSHVVHVAVAPRVASPPPTPRPPPPPRR